MVRNVILQQKEEKEMLAGIPYQPRLSPRIPADFLTSGLINYLKTGPIIGKPALCGINQAEFQAGT
ncbi:MAG TPA: hypothetical protein PLD74_12355 [Prolixibacteraceae bacterium]|jgi:hypothetical protein|nr:hypothetical protein [Prolixibacteraceae bacterium]HQE53144.1 hypothetical protein [Prolixibacteraceae bacterium]HQH77147.1 hypothetical protein [Prolixibacteraceae bacterium]HQJ86553.1 hypothetical protein [Prolixibacteraceae bacterium]